MVLNDQFRRRCAEWTALPMFCLALSFLILVAIAIVLLVEIQYFQMPNEGAGAKPPTGAAVPQVSQWLTKAEAHRAGMICVGLLAAIWPLFFLELVVQYLIRDRRQPFFRRYYMSFVNCICPPLRMCARNHAVDDKVWFPSMGWQSVDDELRDRLEKMFSIPMIIIALTILPILLIEFGMRQQVSSRPWLQMLLYIGTGMIWFAFAAEFIVMVSVAEKKLRYCRQHWLDLAIILLPFIAFLRSLRVVRATRMARLAKIEQLSRMGRLYRLRGLAMRAVRALMILQLINRMFRIGPERQLRKLNMVLREKKKEIDLLQREIKKLEELIAEQREAEAARADEPTREGAEVGTD